MQSPKVLMDECLDRRLVRELHGVTVKTVPEMGWAGLTNGKLLEKAQHHFDIFITSDQNLSFQQNLGKYKIAVIVLCPVRNQLNDLKLLVPSLRKILSGSIDKKIVYVRN